MNFIIIAVSLLQCCLAFNTGCLKREYGTGNIVCVCNERYCDTISLPKQVPTPGVKIYTSNKFGERFTQSIQYFLDGIAPKEGLDEESCQIPQNPCNSEPILSENIKESRVPNKLSYINENTIKKINVDRTRTYQNIIGWGGAFTDSAGINIKNLNENLQKKLLQSYFGKAGIEYNLCRVPIGGTDFSTHGYTYLDEIDDGNYCEDPLLNNFKLATEDYSYKIPLIQEAKKLSKNLLLFSTAWTAPKWMKESQKYNGMMGYLKKTMYQSWANYYIKFLDHYLLNNITFWAISSGNEVFFNMVQTALPGVLWSPTELGVWIRDFLGPALQSSQHSQIKLLAIDDVRPVLPHVIKPILSDELNKLYISGIAIHWYFDTVNNSHILNDLHDAYPDKMLLYTEACNGAFDNEVRLGSWERGEAYASNIIEVVNRWVTGWIDWNMALDPNGGPTYINNYVDAAIIVNATAQEFYKQPMYYALGHFSKFVPRDSVRIYSRQCDSDLKIAAFKRPDTGIVVVILNPTNFTQIRILSDNVRGDSHLQLSPHSISTLIYW